MGLVWVGRAVSGAEQGIKIDWTQWTSQTGFWVVPKGTKNREAAMKALEFFTEPAQQIAFSNNMNWALSLPGACLPDVQSAPGRPILTHLPPLTGSMIWSL